MIDINRQRLIDDIVLFAKNDIGIEEIQPNQGWKDKDYEEFMVRVLHFVKGNAWCVYQAVKPWLKAYSFHDSAVITNILEVFSPLAQTFYNNCKASSRFEVSQEPEIGDIIIWEKWEHNRLTWKGHASLLIELIDETNIITIDGNTSEKHHREGQYVAQKVWKLRYAKKYRRVPDGLYVKGFIKPPII